jgi:hypothetical protein
MKFYWLLFQLFKQMKRLKVLKYDTMQLVSLNTALQASNLLLHETNKNLAETNQIKEIYIGRYMDQCSDYIT